MSRTASLMLVKSHINKHGELHRDKVLTQLLLEWLTFCEEDQAQQLAVFNELKEALAPLLGSTKLVDDTE